MTCLVSDYSKPRLQSRKSPLYPFLVLLIRISFAIQVNVIRQLNYPWEAFQPLRIRFQPTKSVLWIRGGVYRHACHPSLTNERD